MEPEGSWPLDLWTFTVPKLLEYRANKALFPEIYFIE